MSKTFYADVLATGLPTRMYPNLDDEAYYGPEDQGERARDQFAKFYTNLGYDVTVMPDGSTQRYFSGFDLPKPRKPLTAEVRIELEQLFYEQRLTDLAMQTPEIQQHLASGYEVQVLIGTYDAAKGTILTHVEELLE